MRNSIAIVSAGAALSATHALGGWLLTPFFGESAWFWAHASAASSLGVALGYVLGGAAAGRRGRRPRAPLALGILGGALIAALPLLVPPLARAILDRDPESRAAAPLALLLAVTLPGALCASLLRVPAGAAKEGDEGHAALARAMVPFLAGAVLVFLAVEPLLVDPFARPPWTGLWVAGGALALASGAAFGRRGAAAAVLLVGASVGAFHAIPCEARTAEFRGGLARGWSMRVGRYYLETARPQVLDGTELERRWRSLQREVARTSERDEAILAVVDALRSIGRATISREGLGYVCDRTLSPASRAAFGPLIDRVVEIKSDGEGLFEAVFRPDEGAEVASVEIAGKDGNDVALEIGRRVTITLRVETSPRTTRASLDIGPLVIEPAGALESNDTHRTPVVVKRAKLFFDAHLLGVDLEATDTRASAHVRAQGSIGAIQSKEVFSEERRRRM